MRTLYIVSNDTNSMLPTSICMTLLDSPGKYVIYQHSFKELPIEQLHIASDVELIILLWDKNAYQDGWLSAIRKLRTRQEKIIPILFVGLEIALIVEVMNMSYVGAISYNTKVKDFPKYIDQLTIEKRNFVLSTDIMFELVQKIYGERKRKAVS